MHDSEVRTDRRQRRWHEVHDRLFEAACELFMESGYVNTSVDDIAERADVARKTAFNHFARKREFIAEWGNRRRHQVMEALSPDLTAEPQLGVVIRNFFDELAEINVAERPLTICMLSGWRESGGPFDAHAHPMVDILHGFIADAIARREVADSIDPRRIATVLYSSYFGLLFDWCEGSDGQAPFDLRAAFTTLLDVVLGGLPKG